MQIKDEQRPPRWSSREKRHLFFNNTLNIQHVKALSRLVNLVYIEDLLWLPPSQIIIITLRTYRLQER